VGQKVNEMWMGVGQYLVRSWSAFKAKEVGQKLDESWTDFRGSAWQNWAKLGREKVCQGYANDMPEFWSNELLQTYSSITPKITMRLLQFFSNTSPENKGFSLKTAGQSRYEIGIKIVRWVFGRIAVTLRWFVGGMLATGFGKVSVRVRYPQGIKHRQLSLKTRLNNEKVTVKSRKNHRTVFIAYPTLSFIVHSFIVHNKRASYGYTKVTPTLHQECDQLLPNATRNRPLFSLFDITRVSLYVVLPDQKI
jgi:hypothetical protein